MKCPTCKGKGEYLTRVYEVVPLAGGTRRRATVFRATCECEAGRKAYHRRWRAKYNKKTGP